MKKNDGGYFSELCVAIHERLDEEGIALIGAPKQKDKVITATIPAGDEIYSLLRTAVESAGGHIIAINMLDYGNEHIYEIKLR